MRDLLRMRMARDIVVQQIPPAVLPAIRRIREPLIAGFLECGKGLNGENGGGPTPLRDTSAPFLRSTDGIRPQLDIRQALPHPGEGKLALDDIYLPGIN